LRQGRLYLTTPNAIYSHEDLYDVYCIAFEKIRVNTLKINEVLILGFGVGSIPVMLNKKFKMNPQYTGVEADSTIVYWAKKYLSKELLSKLDLENTDAGDFIATCESKFDLVCVDLFVEDSIPEIFLTESFVSDLCELLQPNGLIMWNHLADTELSNSKTENFFSAVFSKVFPESKMMNLGANIMLLNRQL
jgi:spermidine synthase